MKIQHRVHRDGKQITNVAPKWSYYLWIRIKTLQQLFADSMEIVMLFPSIDSVKLYSWLYKLEYFWIKGLWCDTQSMYREVSDGITACHFLKYIIYMRNRKTVFFISRRFRWVWRNMQTKSILFLFIKKNNNNKYCNL